MLNFKNEIEIQFPVCNPKLMCEYCNLKLKLCNTFPFKVTHLCSVKTTSHLKLK